MFEKGWLESQVQLRGATQIPKLLFSHSSFSVIKVVKHTLEDFSNILLAGKPTTPNRVSASNFVALDTDKELEILSEYQFFIQNRTNCRK